MLGVEFLLFVDDDERGVKEWWGWVSFLGLRWEGSWIGVKGLYDLKRLRSEVIGEEGRW